MPRARRVSTGITHAALEGTATLEVYQPPKAPSSGSKPSSSSSSGSSKPSGSSGSTAGYTNAAGVSSAAIMHRTRMRASAPVIFLYFMAKAQREASARSSQTEATSMAAYRLSFSLFFTTRSRLFRSGSVSCS